MDNFQDKQLLLLPAARSLLINAEGPEPSIAEIPEWLAKFLGYTPSELTGKPVNTVLEPVLSGISELIETTASNKRSVAGFKAFLADKQGRKHQLLLDSAFKSQPDGTPMVAVAIQHAAMPVIPDEANFYGLIGQSDSMQHVFNKIRMYSVSDATVLINGETGAGKEGVASAIHQMSRRAEKPFVTMNCSAITDTLFESELFGHEKGSFTGAVNSHRGRFERANGGTLFLDEIGDLPLLSQAKLLRVLETSQIERVGSETPIRINVRVVAATNKNLEQLCHTNEFRLDLFYRINALQIIIPPLRERPDDLELLIQHFIKLLNRKYNRKICCLTREAVQLLKQYQWPGNVRELRNLMERLFAENQTDVIGLRSLKEWYEERMNAAQYAAENAQGYQETVSLPMKRAIPLGMPTHPEPAAKKYTEADLKNAFKMAGGNITRASELLGIHKATFYRLLKSLNMERSDLDS